MTENGSSKPGIALASLPWCRSSPTEGALRGLEALSLQGIPVDDLLLTRESEDQLADLAGNAMTTTVVGACILSALTVGFRPFMEWDRGRDHDQSKRQTQSQRPYTADTGTRERSLYKEQTMILGATGGSSATASAMLAEAGLSARMCVSEGQHGISTSQLWQCTACGCTVSDARRGRPKHRYVPLNVGGTGGAHDKTTRIPPDRFKQTLLQHLPMLLKFVPVEALTQSVPQNHRSCSDLM